MTISSRPGHPELGTVPLVQECLSETILGALVAFPTVSEETNLPLIGYISDYLAGHGVTASIVANDDGRIASIFASIGPDVSGGIVLSGHTDVVPTDGQTWRSDPFTLTCRDERLYGRGACDMKGFLAVTLAMVPEMLSAGLKRPIHLAFSHDEEIGCLGAPMLIERMGAVLPPPSAVIVGEPTMMKVVTGHKGVVKVTARVHGKAVHSSVLHKGVSATVYAARLAVWLDERMRTNREKGAYDARFDPPYTTLHSGVIQGGTAFNITARDCILSSDIRTLPEESSAGYIAEFSAHADALADEMRQIDPQSGIDIEIECDVPGCRKEEAGPAEALVRQLTGDNGDHVVAYGTEAGQFQHAGLSAVVCGPGNMDQGHIADEYIERSQLRAGEAFQRRLIERLAA